MRADDLTGEALRIFESWLACGYSEQQALEEVRRSGVIVEQDLTEIFESIGMTPGAAKAAAQGRNGGVPGHPFDEAVKTYEGLGLSPELAKAAAIGRDMTESQARRWYSEAAGSQMPAAEAPGVRKVVETATPAVRKVVSLLEKFESDGKPATVVRADELVRLGVPVLEAQRRAFIEIYGREPQLPPKPEGAA